MRLIISLFLSMFLFSVQAQVKTKFNNVEPLSKGGKFMKNFHDRKPYVIPARDINLLLQKEAQENSDYYKRLIIAEPIKVNIDVVNEAFWLQENGFSFGRFTLVAAGAKSISLNFNGFYLPDLTEIYVYSENGEMITGPISESENNPNNSWGSWVYKGNKVTIEIKTPSISKSNLKLNISNIGYGYKEIYHTTKVNGFGESGGCNINVICPEGSGWENERNSVALVLSGNGSSLCSGALVNNTSDLNIPYFLTANHCYTADPNPQDWRFTFQAWSSTCDPSSNADGITFNGAILRARNSASDFCLLELSTLPPAGSCITAAGWNRTSTAAANATGIHHPSGDVMKISFDNNPVIRASAFGTSNNHWKVVWDSGVTESGSSGSPLFNQNNQIVGQLEGGPAGCSSSNLSDFYGSFDRSWTGGGTNSSRLRNWLDPQNTGVVSVNTRELVSTSISGPLLICNSETYSLINQPPGTSVYWVSNNQNGLTIDSETGVATRVNNFSGVVAIQAIINGGCSMLNVSRNIWVGNPGASSNTLIYPAGLRGVDPVNLSPSSIYQFRIDQVEGYPTSWTWLLPTGFSFFSGNTTSNPYIQTSPSNGTYTLFCRVNNNCGFSYTNNLTINVGSGGGGTPLRVRDDSEEYEFSEADNVLTHLKTGLFPNPASEYINVEIDEMSYLSLIGSAGQCVFSTTGNSRITIQVNDIPNGIYFLRISNENGIQMHKVIVVH
jgi:lysyl endopeptidase